VDNGGGNGRGFFEVEVRMDAMKLTNVIIAALRERVDEAKIVSRVGGGQ